MGGVDLIGGILMGGEGLIGGILMGGEGLIGGILMGGEGLIVEGLRAGVDPIVEDLKAGEGTSRLRPRDRVGWVLWPARVRPKCWSRPWNPKKKHNLRLSKKRPRRLKRLVCGPSGERLAKPELNSSAPRPKKPFSGAT